MRKAGERKKHKRKGKRREKDKLEELELERIKDTKCQKLEQRLGKSSEGKIKGDELESKCRREIDPSEQDRNEQMKRKKKERKYLHNQAPDPRT